MARGLGKVHLTSTGVPRLSNPNVSSIDRAMQRYLKNLADIEEPSIMSEVGKYVKMFDGETSGDTPVY